MGTTNNFQPKKPRQLFLGAFAALETDLARVITETRPTPLTSLTIVVPTRLLGLHLQRTLPFSHANLHFQTLSEISDLQFQITSPQALELLCRQLARKCDGYFAPVKDTPGFANALLATFTDLKESGLATLPGNTPKLRELAAAYDAFCQAGLPTEADLLLKSPISHLPSPIFLYGFYDLNVAQRVLIERLAPAAVFFPWFEHSAPYATPLLDWFRSHDYAIVSSPISSRQSPISVLSCPGETAEVREAVRRILDYLRANPGKTLADCAILCRSRDQYDAILRDTLPALGLRAFFRGGRPLSEHPDARLLLLLLEVIRTDFSRAAVMELACHTGSRSHWDARTVELGIVGGQQQWRARLQTGSDKALSDYINKLFTAAGAVPSHGSWRDCAEAIIAAYQDLDGQHPAVIAAVRDLAELDAVETPVTFDTFAEFCQKVLDSAREQPEKFQGGGLFVSDVMGARGLSFDCVVVLGLVEKSFPRLIREDPLLLDQERDPLAIPLKSRGYDEEHLLFDLACATARHQLILTFPRLEATTGKPRVPSIFIQPLINESTPKVPMSALAARVPALDEREFDLPVLADASDVGDYLAAISPLVMTGVCAERNRWRHAELTRYDGLVESKPALQLLRDRFGLDKLVISATSLEDFFGCPFYYFQKHVLHLEPWEEPEAAVVIDPLDLGTLYHRILEVYYRDRGDLSSVIEQHLRDFERAGVTGYPTVWEIKKDIIRQELTAFVAREQRRLAGQWTPAEFEKEFSGVAVAPPMRLRGKIDRIDRSADGQRACVLDYKTGKLPRGLKDDALAGGEALQLPLYLLAAEQLLPGALVEAAGYLYFTLRGGYRLIQFSRIALDSRRAELTRLLETAAVMIRDGHFAQYATEEGCRRCEFRAICGNGILKLYAHKANDQRMAGFRHIKEEVP